MPDLPPLQDPSGPAAQSATTDMTITMQGGEASPGTASGTTMHGTATAANHVPGFGRGLLEARASPMQVGALAASASPMQVGTMAASPHGTPGLGFAAEETLL